MSVTTSNPKSLDDTPKREDAGPKPFRLVTVRASPRPGVDVDRPRALEVEDDQARFGRG